ncbi:YjbE family integral membrane protein [Lederbergia galactosidilyticus]|uniref:TerC family protein n=1 Tax=Lederbergia galactosidilytica TaxID=217031 RepID=UPI001AE5272A|nr:TerC family protein [Lederbergia galactosidilytica]MBP1913079.1 YjbE family integral membrane protein [Lederbergia galactosidilytica]
MIDNGLTMLQVTFTAAAWIALLKIIAIDIILSGDNAIVIAMATRKLSKEQQNKAIYGGIVGAVVLRILFAIIIVQLLEIPFVHIIAGTLLLWIAYKVLVGDDQKNNQISTQTSLLKAIGTIILADAVMSLDNVVAIAGAADGQTFILVLGVAISIPVMIFYSKLIVKIMDKYTWISYIGSAILAWVAGEMLMKDQLIGMEESFEYIVLVFLIVLVLVLGFYKNKRKDSKSVTKLREH